VTGLTQRRAFQLIETMAEETAATILAQLIRGADGASRDSQARRRAGRGVLVRARRAYPSMSRPVAVVTGGARRLGRHLCVTLAARGYDVVVLYRESEDDAALARPRDRRARPERAALAVDVGVRAEVAAVFADIATKEGRVDLLVNNVGNYDPRHVTALDPATWDRTLATNLSGAYYCCYEALASMREGGSIVNIGMAGLEGIRANVMGADYYVSKTGLLALTRSLAAGYAERKIRVNMVSPGQLEQLRRSTIA
jgi:NAD(P)-dependent dehydrogenase (short-subunit alcohol dehydrogenase family)